MVRAPRNEGRAQILAAARQCFMRLGYHGTSIRDIAREANMTSAAMYHHFPSKQLILVEIMEVALRAAYEATYQASADAGPSATAQLTAVMTEWTLFHTQRTDEALVSATEIRSLEAESRQRVVRLRDQQELLFRRTVEAGIAEESFATKNPVLVARALIALGTTLVGWYRPGGDVSLEELIGENIQMALDLVQLRSART